jgi:hypothetical protein
MPILGILASSTQVAAGDFESIATVTVGSGGSSSVEFTSIPSTFAHLQIRGISRLGSGSGTLPTISLQFNGDTGANYASHQIRADGSSVSTDAGSNQNQIAAISSAGNTQTASVFSGTVLDLLDYANTNKFKTIRALTAADFNGTGWFDFRSGLWRSTSAVTSIKLYGAQSFAQYSHFALYGIKSA